MKTEARENFVLAEARSIISKRLRQPGGVIGNIAAVQQYLTMEYGLLESEQFGCMFLDGSYALINHLKMFKGTINYCATYPREIAREALLQNATFVVLIHNHPSHSPLPSEDDKDMTLKIKEILAVLDIALFDHIIVAGPNLHSMRTSGNLS